jgi:glycosyltransferase involved in cell wall biosynthesis
MNILQVIPVFNPPELYGGSQQVVYQISKELVKRGHNVCIYTSDAKRSNLDERVWDAVERVDGINVVHFKNVNAPLTRAGFVITPEMRKSLAQEWADFDLVHVHEVRSYQNIIVWLIARRHKLPYIVHAHGLLGGRIGLTRKICDLVYGTKVLKDASMCLALNEYEAEQYRHVGVQDERIAILSNGINLAEYSDLGPKGLFKKKFGITENEQIVLYLGRIHRAKGIDFLVRAFAYLADNNRENIKLVIAGADDGYLNEVKTLVNSLGLSDLVLLAGLLSEEDKIAAYVDSAICAYLGPFEPFGLVTLEAAACGTPVIVSKESYMASIVDEGRFGFSVTYGDIYELAGIMAKILNNDDLSRSMGQKGRKFVFGNFDWTNIAVKLEDIYKDVVKRNRWNISQFGIQKTVYRKTLL